MIESIALIFTILVFFLVCILLSIGVIWLECIGVMKFMDYLQARKESKNE